MKKSGSLSVDARLRSKYKIWCTKRELKMKDVTDKLIKKLLKGEICYDVKYAK
jgi:ribosomal protein S10